MNDIIDSINQKLQPVDRCITSHRVTISRTLLVIAFLSLSGLFFPSFMKESGEISFNLLMFILILSPLAKITGIRTLSLLLPFRKELGILMGMLAVVHTGLFLIPNYSQLAFFAQNEQTRIWYFSWLIATVFAILLTITSNTWSMKFLGKYWKWLHRFAYLIAILVVVHVMALGAMNWHLEIWIALPVVLWFVLKMLDIFGYRMKRA